MDIFTVFPILLKSTLWGEDRGSDDISSFDDIFFSFQTHRITPPGIYSFSAIIYREVLNEDIFRRINFFRYASGRDEVYNEFSIVSGSRFLSCLLRRSSFLT
jgi:hypothetical protein